LPALFLRFLRFGLLAWGGPVAQIGMLRHELVDRDRWASPPRFLRALAVYQALPGPEAHELCCWFGWLSRGRVGSVVAGLGFMLPGTLLTLLCARLYVAHGLDAPLVAAAFAGMQPAVVALVVRAVPRIGGHALRTKAAWVAAGAGVVSEALGLPFWVPLLFGALWLPNAAHRARAAVLLLAFLAAVVWLRTGPAAAIAARAAPAAATPLLLFAIGLKAGLLTFGGAYTAIPVVRDETVVARGWLTDAQFLDAIAVGGVLPAPLVVFGTFVGYVAGGCAGALAATAGIFLPAFGFTLVGHRWIERLVEAPRAHVTLDGIAAAVVGLIAATAVRLAHGALDAPWRALAFAAALAAALRWRTPWLVPAIVLGGAGVGLVFGPASGP
jgi:chromate transporter